MKVFFYSVTTGLFTGGAFVGAENLIELATPEGCAAFIADAVDIFNSRVDVSTVRIVSYQTPPLTAAHKISVGDKRWALEQMAVRRRKTLAATITETIAEQREIIRAN